MCRTAKNRPSIIVRNPISLLRELEHNDDNTRQRNAVLQKYYGCDLKTEKEVEMEILDLIK